MNSMLQQQSATGERRSAQQQDSRPRHAAALIVTLRPARRMDAHAIEALIDRFAAEGLMLPRATESIVMTLDDFVVAVDGRGRVLGCGALREYSPSLAEIASLAVAREAQGAGIGSAVIRELEALAGLRGVTQLFALTLVPALFEALGYGVVDRARYPEKIRRDCTACARRRECREICVARWLPPNRSTAE
jgi:N-acetylglutamate synthase-like GNAT family acetyltransferase